MRYYQLVASGRQLALFIFAIAGLLLVAFLVGLSVGLAERQQQLEQEAWGAKPSEPLPTPIPAEPPPATPTPLPSPMPEVVVAEPTVPPTPTVMPAPTAAPTPTPRPTLRPSPVTVPISAGVWVQVGAFSSKADAEGVRHRVVALGFRPEQVKVLSAGFGKYRVRVGPFPDRESGSRVVARLREGGFREAFVVSQ